LENGASALSSPHGPTADPRDFTVVGIGASAGGLDACRKLMAALPAGHGMAFILVQHLAPTHESMMVNLLSGHTQMTVCQVTDGMPIERDHLYVIPPGTYLSVGKGALHLSAPEARHGARLPFDFLLHSLAEECGPRAICVILSGTGADGSVGLKAIKEKGGFAIAQNPDEAGFDGMPRSAIATGAVDLVLPVADIPGALIGHDLRVVRPNSHDGLVQDKTSPDWLPRIVDILRANTAHDFRPYKHGTLLRRIERRMALRGIETSNANRYLDILRSDTGELDLLAKDLLINVTSFFRDAAVFDLLAKTIVPDLVRNQPSEQPFRLWISGCSTGEEAYSLAMLFREAIAEAKRNLKLQVFASDVDPDAIATARNGLYADAIETDVSPARLAHFFTKENIGYRVSPDLRASIIFTVQDVLADPPFSRLDLVSCRNLLIYLGPEAQSKVIALFDFALREGGILLLGSSETIGNIDASFEVISKHERIFRHIGRARPGVTRLSIGSGDGMRLPARQGLSHGPSRQLALAELCRRRVLEAYAPAAVLINRRHECLYSLGPADRYLRVAPGHPTHDLLAMAPDDLRIKLRSAIQQAVQDNACVVVAGGQYNRDGKAKSFNIEVRPLVSEGEELLLICFADEQVIAARQTHTAVPGSDPRVTELEQELAATRTELQAAIRNLEYSSEEQRAINEEALSINEEFQSTNEELLTSKEELQSLNEELTALNSQLQETLERQRTTANDLQNVLYSTDVATLFLDRNLNIRFFTPATKALFSVIPSDIGRPLADLNSLSADRALTDDAEAVLANLTPVDREIETRSGVWFTRRILPYRTDGDGVEGVVITYTDVSERKRVRIALEAAKQEAERATIAKSRFLAAASHDLRQPLQTFMLLQGLLAKNVVGDKAKQLVARLDDTLGVMTGMLDALLDINRIDAGAVHAEMVDFPVNSLLDRMRDEFTLLSKEKGLKMHVVPCGAVIHGDPRLLEQMMRNLLSNALKYTERGKILLGCRRHGRELSIEIWDTGIGIPQTELHTIFEEYHQLDNAARERTRGLGLGLSIVQRLGNILGAAVRVRSQAGKGSVFTIDVKLSPQGQVSRRTESTGASSIVDQDRRTGMILVVEDDPEVRDLLELFLKDAGHQTKTAPHGLAALDLIVHEPIRPDLILADYNLPNDMDGLRLTARIREQLNRHIPVIILTGDISTETMREIASQDCVQLNKPVKLNELTQTIQRLLAISQQAARGPSASHAGPATLQGAPIIFVVDDDDRLRETVRSVLEDDGRTVEDFATAEAFLAAYHPGGDACVLIDAYLPGMSGLDLLQRLRSAGHQMPAIMITGDSDVPMAVQAMKAGACDFVEKPIGRSELLGCIDRALMQSRDSSTVSSWRESAARHLAGLTSREREIMILVLDGHPSKNIAADLGISQRTVENHRASIMKKTGSSSLPALARLALTAASNGDTAPSDAASGATPRPKYP
jgi:two-component system, chemotaxis family, CheB/CheR fusion protein